MRKSDHQFLFAKDIIKILSYVLENYPELKFTLDYGKRNEDTQLQLMKLGVSKVKNPRDSMHVHRLAEDIIWYWKGVYLDPDKRSDWSSETMVALNIIGKVWEGYNKENRAGVFWSNPFDPNHLERYVKEYTL